MDPKAHIYARAGPPSPLAAVSDLLVFAGLHLNALPQEACEPVVALLVPAGWSALLEPALTDALTILPSLRLLLHCVQIKCEVLVIHIWQYSVSLRPSLPFCAGLSHQAGRRIDFLQTFIG